MKIINLSDFDPDWCWLKDEFKHEDQEWFHYSSKSIHLPDFLPKKDSLKKAGAAWHAATQARKGPSILVSHGPRPTFYGANFAKFIAPEMPHLAYAFNFTDLPQGKQRKLMAKAFQRPTKFVTFSKDERQLYADYFDMPIERIDMQYWSVHPPVINAEDDPVETGPYICALGSQARDYKTLVAAMKQLKNIKLVIVATPENMAGIEIPPNVTIYSGIPFSKALNILAHSQFMILPLRDSKVPCGHGSIVSSMFYKKAIIISDSSGIYDYVKNEETGLFYEPLNADDLSQKILSLWEDKAKIKKLSEAAFSFANTHCTEKTAVAYFSNFLDTLK